MNISNERVEHRLFGPGTVVEHTETVVTVKFDGCPETKRFIYPEAFGSFIKLCDPARQLRLECELTLLHKRAETVRKQSEAEHEKRLLEELAAKKAASKKRSAVKKTVKAPKKAEKAELDDDMADDEARLHEVL